MKLHRRHMPVLQPPKARLYILCLFLAAGVLAGFLAGRTVASEDLLSLSRYVTGYARLNAEEPRSAGLWQVLWTYLRYPAAAFSAGLYSLGRDADPADVRGPGLLPVVRGAVLCRCTGKAGRGIGAGGAGTAVSVHHTMSADDSGGQLCVCVAPGRTSKAGGERPAERDHLCVCIADRDSGGVRPGAAAFCMADARLDLKERGVRDT